MIAARRIKRSIPTFVCFLAPLVLVKAASTFVAGPGPLQATASILDPTYNEQATPSETERGANEAPTAESLAAAARARAVRESAETRNPFYYEPIGPNEPVAVEVVEDEQPLDAQLQAIMASSRGNTALIDGQPYRVGDVLPGGAWTVVSITSDDRSVVLRHVELDEERRLVVETPGD